MILLYFRLNVLMPQYVALMISFSLSAVHSTEQNTKMHRQTIKHFKKKEDLKFLMYTNTFLKSINDTKKFVDSYIQSNDNTSNIALSCISDGK